MQFEKFYYCDCHSGGILLDFDKEFKIIELSFWSQGFYGNILSIKERIRWCWNTLKTGKPYTDMVILDKETAFKLGNDLINFAKQKEGEKNG